MSGLDNNIVRWAFNVLPRQCNRRSMTFICTYINASQAWISCLVSICKLSVLPLAIKEKKNIPSQCSYLTQTIERLNTEAYQFSVGLCLACTIYVHPWVDWLSCRILRTCSICFASKILKILLEGLSCVFLCVISIYQMIDLQHYYEGLNEEATKNFHLITNEPCKQFDAITLQKSIHCHTKLYPGKDHYFFT